MDLAYFGESLLYIVFSGDLVEVDSDGELPRLDVDCFRWTQLAKQSPVLLEVFHPQRCTHDDQAQRELGVLPSQPLFMSQLASSLRNPRQQTDQDVGV